MCLNVSFSFAAHSYNVAWDFILLMEYLTDGGSIAK